MIYGFTFTKNSCSDAHLLLTAGPEHALRLTSRFVYNESAPSYEAARTDHKGMKATLWQEVIARLHAKIERNDKYRVAGWYADMAKDSDEQVMCNGDCGELDQDPENHGCGCTDVLSKACTTCRNMTLLAFYNLAFPEKVPWMTKTDGSGELLFLGLEAEKFCRNLHTNGMRDPFCMRNCVKEAWRDVLDEQQFRDARCWIRFDAVAEYYRTFEPCGWKFTESNVYEVEKRVLWTRLKAFEHFNNRYRSGGELNDWRDEYQDRATALEATWMAEGGMVLPQVPFDDEKIEWSPPPDSDVPPTCIDYMRGPKEDLRRYGRRVC